MSLIILKGGSMLGALVCAWLSGGCAGLSGETNEHETLGPVIVFGALALLLGLIPVMVP